MCVCWIWVLCNVFVYRQLLHDNCRKDCRFPLYHLQTPAGEYNCNCARWRLIYQHSIGRNIEYPYLYPYQVQYTHIHKRLPKVPPTSRPPSQSALPPPQPIPIPTIPAATNRTNPQRHHRSGVRWVRHGVCAEALALVGCGAKAGLRRWARLCLVLVVVVVLWVVWGFGGGGLASSQS